VRELVSEEDVNRLVIVIRRNIIVRSIIAYKNSEGFFFKKFLFDIEI
jgi:hypothetical protein